VRTSKPVRLPAAVSLRTSGGRDRPEPQGRGARPGAGALSADSVK